MSSYVKDSFLNSFWKVAYESHGESGLPATVESEATKRHPGSTRTSGLLCEQGCFVLRWALTPLAHPGNHFCLHSGSAAPQWFHSGRPGLGYTAYNQIHNCLMPQIRSHASVSMLQKPGLWEAWLFSDLFEEAILDTPTVFSIMETIESSKKINQIEKNIKPFHGKPCLL